MKSNLTGKYLTFRLAEEDYGVPLRQVKEIIGMMPVTAVPRTPGYVKGVINLRGKVIPVSDLRLRFGMDAIPYNDRTCIIVVDIQGIEQARSSTCAKKRSSRPRPLASTSIPTTFWAWPTWTSRSRYSWTSIGSSIRKTWRRWKKRPE